jgi:putative Ca2+/H+ antiporter (TMEM165/GDT1 family)
MTDPIPFLNVLVSSFGLVAASEMGDKTQLLAFALATRFKKPWAIMAGILTATLVNHGLASWGGAWVASHVPEMALRVALSLTFIGFGVWILIPDKDQEGPQEGRWGAYLTTTVAFFFAEMGDKTQLATVALGARFGSFYMVTLGTTLGMLFSDGLAVLVGEKLAERISMKWVRRSAAVLFFIFGMWLLINGTKG